MADPKGFLKINREPSGYRPVKERVRDFAEVEQRMDEPARRAQASRCMDCGVPFCHWACPVANVMPEWQDALYQGDWEKAIAILHSTNNFPEFTGRVCPALCEASCVLALENEPVTIRENELAVIEKAFASGYIKPKPPRVRTGKKIAVVGAGPAGLACADLLNKWGHTVTLYEKNEAVGGLLRFGIPDFKLDKTIIDRRVNILLQEGLEIKTGVLVGSHSRESGNPGGTVCIPAKQLQSEHDAICLTLGAEQPRDLQVPGRELTGVHFAMEFLTGQNRLNSETAGEAVEGANPRIRPNVEESKCITAKAKHVLVIGGGDTGADCVGTANRQGAKSVTQIEIMPKPPVERTDAMPWPMWPTLYKESSSHKEGCERMWAVSTKKFEGESGAVKKVVCIKVEWISENGKQRLQEIPGSEFEISADLVLLAMGFVAPVHAGLLDALGVAYDARGNVAVNADYATSVPKIFSAGDTARGASLVVWAIQQGRAAATAMHRFLL